MDPAQLIKMIMLTSLAGHFFSDEQVTFMMQNMDEDGNGTIEAQEFVDGLPLLATVINV